MTRTFDPHFIQLIEEGQPLFQFRNGSTLKFAGPGDSGHWPQWWKTKFSPRILEASDKRRQYRLGTRTSQSSYFLVPLDLDKLPLGFHSFDELREHQERRYSPDSYFTFTTRSGKPKTVACLEKEGGARSLSHNELQLAVAALAEPSLVPFLDTSAAALDIVFVPPCLSTLAKLSAWVRRARPIVWASLGLPSSTRALNAYAGHLAGSNLDWGRGECACSAPIPEAPIRPKDIEPYLGPLPENIDRLKKRSESREAFIRLLLGTRDDEIGISTRYFAKRIRECFGLRTTQQTVSKHVASLIAAGQLKVTNSFFRPGTWHPQAKRYALTGDLAIARNDLALAQPRLEQVFDPSAQIESGQWYRTSYLGAQHFYPRLDDFVAWATSREGITAEPERQRHFWEAWASVAKQHGQVEEKGALKKYVRSLIQEGIRQTNQGGMENGKNQSSKMDRK